MNTDPSSLRESFNKWAQSRSGDDQPQAQQPGIFTSFTDSINSTVNDVYNRLPIYRQDTIDQEPSWFQLSRFERLLLFFCFLLGSIACFVICGFLFPILATKPRKFGLLWSMGSLLFVLAFGVLQGPVSYLKHLITKERLPFTAFFFGTCLGTIYFAAFAKATLLTIVFAVLQLFSIIWYAVSYFPFGRQGLTVLTNVGIGQARGALNI
ncbi:Sft2p SCDLUD_000127 [Saccharomycodes ludwigii]|uniref:Sft2p n=1 Tax=Saccharomycodes ludwigii TaxID=36035 RepID=UPI001E862111|nr:hypothetical protein SCDLUD_000127 [Saccharomycodes ludwigii]KAH3902548.1 hypothetical protein SCDLUD_000127 [Saccharomycodes ludwigii]